MNFISVNIATLPGSKSYGGSHTYTHLLSAFDQHGFRPGHSTTSALLQLTSDVATGFNQRKQSHWTICVDVDLTAVFDTVNYNCTAIKDCTINASGGNLLIDVDLHQRQTISYKLQRRQVEGKDNPYLRSAMLEVVTYAIQFLHSWHDTADRTSQH